MIDLRKKSLPNAITVNGKDYFLNTDFRLWLDFGDKFFGKRTDINNFAYLFKDEIPYFDCSEQLAFFYLNPNSTPKITFDGTSEKLVDYIEDGEYIFASFMQAYHINLIEVEYMHWHIFKALFENLPPETKMSEIIGYRCYKKTNKKHDILLEEQKMRWSLGKNETKDEELEKELNELFYNS